MPGIELVGFQLFLSFALLNAECFIFLQVFLMFVLKYLTCLVYRRGEAGAVFGQ